MASTMSTWNPNDHKYKCCCNICHVKTGAKAIVRFEILVLICAFVLWVCLVILYGGQNNNTLAFIIILIAPVLGIVILERAYRGLKKERCVFLVPHIVCQVIHLVSLGIFSIILIEIMATGGGFLATTLETDERVLVNGEYVLVKSVAEGTLVRVGIFGFLTLAISAVFQIWFLSIFLACYRFFRDKSDHAHVEQMMMGDMTETLLENPPTYSAAVENPPTYSAIENPPTYSAVENPPMFYI